MRTDLASLAWTGFDEGQIPFPSDAGFEVGKEGSGLGEGPNADRSDGDARLFEEGRGVCNPEGGSISSRESFPVASPNVSLHCADRGRSFAVVESTER